MFFYIYCFIGWVIESAIVSFNSKKLVNRGFMRGPLLPIYGFGAITILFVCLPVRETPTLVFIFGMLSTSVLEYFTGWLMETIFKTRYWDYSYMKFNIKGRVSLMTSLFWGFLSLLLTDFLHGAVEGFILDTPTGTIIIFDIMVSVIFVTDLVYAFKTAFDVKKLIDKLGNIKEELKELEDKVSGDIEAFSDKLSGKINEKESVQWIKTRIDELRLEYQEGVGRMNFFKRDFINANPTARSKKFNDVLIEIREKINSRKN